MARAQSYHSEVEKVVTEVVSGVDLILSREEAEALASVLAVVGGNPTTTRRGLTAGVLRALAEADVTYDTSDLDRSPVSGGVWFLPQETEAA